MKKFFLFKRRDVDLSSTAVSDSGEGLDVLAIPTDSLAFMTAEYGKILIVFNNSTIYEESNLIDGESFKKTSVYVSCEPGSEASLIEDILKFISSDRTTSNIMRFDAVLGKTTASRAIVSDFTDVKAEIKQHPVSRVSQQSSTKTFIGATTWGIEYGEDNTNDGIDFGQGNAPVIDLSHSNISHSSSTVNGWTNSGTGGSTYNVSSVSGSPAYVATGGITRNGLSTPSATLTTSQNLGLANTFSTENEFTFFCVFGRTVAKTQESKYVGPIAQTTDASDLFFLDPLDVDRFKFSFSNSEDPDGFVYGRTNLPIVGTKRTAYVFVIRRDADSNVFFYDATGSVVSIVNGNTTPPNTTNGAFTFSHIGNAGPYKFQGDVARVGVIERDIGTSSASKLALDLAELYTPKN